VFVLVTRFSLEPITARFQLTGIGQLATVRRLSAVLNYYAEILTHFIIALVLLLTHAPASAQLKKVRLSATSVAVTELQFRMALLKGFYREEGLDVEIILIRGAVGMQALLGGSVDDTSAAGSIIAGAVRGVSVWLVLVVNAKPQFIWSASPTSNRRRS